MKKISIIIVVILIVVSSLFLMMRKEDDLMYVIPRKYHYLVNDVAAIEVPIFVNNPKSLEKLSNASGYLVDDTNKILIDQFVIRKIHDEQINNQVMYGHELIFYFNQLSGTLHFKLAQLELNYKNVILSIYLGEIYLTNDQSNA